MLNDYEIARIEFIPGLCGGRARFEVRYADRFDIVTLSEQEIADLIYMLREVVDDPSHPLAPCLSEMERAHDYIRSYRDLDPVRPFRREDHRPAGLTDRAIQEEAGLPYSLAL